MRIADRTLSDWLGSEGVAFVLRHSLDRPSLVRIANARRITIPGMRNQSVPIDRLATALAEKFLKDDATCRALLSALDTAQRKSLDEWRKLTAEEASARVGEDKHTAPASARLIYALARTQREGLGPDQARSLFERASAPARREGRPEPSGEDLARQQDLAEKLAATEAVLEKARAREKQVAGELSQKKFDLNNLRLQFTRTREQQERLEKDLSTLQKTLDESINRRKGPGSDEILTRVGQMLELQRKSSAQVEKLAARAAREEKSQEKSSSAGRAIDEMRRELTGIRKGLDQSQAQTASTLKSLGAALGSAREELAALRTAVPARAASKSRTGRLQRADREGPERAGLFVDVQNVFYGARQQNARLDFEALLETVSAGRRMLRTSAYIVETKEIDQSAFISLLQQRGYEVRRKPLLVRADGSSKGDWDMEIALDVLDICEALDVLVLVTGDGDFTSLVNKVKQRGVEVEVYSFPRNTAKSLREAATRFTAIDRRMLIKLPKDDPEPGLFNDPPAEDGGAPREPA